MKASLLVFNQYFRPLFTHFYLRPHLLDPRFLLIQTRHDSFRCFLLPNHGRSCRPVETKKLESGSCSRDR